MTITMNRWGSDHWSTFAYAETCAVDGGYLDMRRMRLDGNQYPTRLKDAEVRGHNDMDCLKDAADLGLLKVVRAIKRTGNKPGDFVATYQVEFTKRGQDVSAQLRAHKMAGGSFREFVAA